jgi:single-stranded DNA-binding protein
MVTVNVVVLAGTVSADPVQRRMPRGHRSSNVAGA